MNQHEITERRPLLDASGNLTEPGYAKTLLPVYRRSDIQANKLRIKEWDYYCINNGHFALALTIADNSYMGLDSISLLNLDEGWEITKSPMRLLPMGKAVVITARGDAGGPDFVSRFFAPEMGIAEDPVTGSSHSMLVPFWADRLGKDRFVARQLSARGGTLHCALTPEAVLISGRVVPYLKGEIFV